MVQTQQQYDVVVVGGGHNGLVSAAYLARAGLSVLVLERLPRTGGAAVSAEAFPGFPVRLSRYSYLVSLMPQQIIEDLGLDLELRSRTVASYTPWQRGDRHGGLLIERPESDRTRASMADLTGSDDDYRAWQGFYARMSELAAVINPTLTRPLPLERELRSAVDPSIWDDFVANPLSQVIESTFADDTVRGVVATDALIGTFAAMDDPSGIQNRCFLYHLIGNGTGEWRVPVGGMGRVTDALLRAATEAGAEVITSAGVSAIRSDADGAEITWHDGEREHGVRARHVLANVAPWVLKILQGNDPDPATKPQGAQLKVNLLLNRLPALKSGIDPAVAFAGTLHLSEDYSQLQSAYDTAASGRVPAVLPGEVYCHSLTDPSILGEMAGHGAQTLTYFGLHAPASLFESGGQEARTAAIRAALASINEVLAEPIESVIARDKSGAMCIEAKVPQEVEADLAMPGGHIFHGDLEWPWAPNRARLETPAEQWGVQTDSASVLLCGSGARRGGAVSGLGGHNAAMAVLASR